MYISKNECETYNIAVFKFERCAEGREGLLSDLSHFFLEQEHNVGEVRTHILETTHQFNQYPIWGKPTSEHILKEGNKFCGHFTNNCGGGFFFDKWWNTTVPFGLNPCKNDDELGNYSQVVESSSCVPIPSYPRLSEIKDNGRTVHKDDFSWWFEWSECTIASDYPLYVKYQTAENPTIDETGIKDKLYQSNYGYWNIVFDKW